MKKRIRRRKFNWLILTMLALLFSFKMIACLGDMDNETKIVEETEEEESIPDKDKN
ncbi:MAG: hypothetical protein QQN41_12740 [Nitrosopumilus sp.]